MNATGLTHVCFGNHECDVPFPDMLNRIKESRFKWISTNMALPTDSIPPLPEWDVITVRGGGQVTDFPVTDTPADILRHTFPPERVVLIPSAWVPC